MKRMANAISLHGNPIFDALSRKHYPQILQIGNEQGDLPIAEMLDPSAYEEGGKYNNTDTNGTHHNPEDIEFHSCRNSRTQEDEASETEIVLESLLSLGASGAVEIRNFRPQTAIFDHPSSFDGFDSRMLARGGMTYTLDHAMYDSFHPLQNGTVDISSRDSFDDRIFVDGCEMYPQPTSVIHRSLPSIGPPGISTENERRFLHHFLYVISARITSPDRGIKNPFRNSFARLATDFPPLLHGILAISAADLLRFDRTITPYEALAHYHGCLQLLATALSDPALMLGDEALATVCLLFLHEVRNDCSRHADNR